MGSAKGRIGDMGGITKAAIIAGGAGTLLIAAAQTKPEDAASNIAAWLNVLGVDQVPDVLARASTDMWATLLGATVVALAVAWTLGFKSRPAVAREPPAPSLEPEPTRPSLADHQKEAGHAALIAMHQFLDDRVDPFVARAGKVAAWTDLVRAGHIDAMAKLRVLRERILPLAADLAATERRHKRELEMLGISPANLLACIEAMALPVENLYQPVWKTGFARRLLIRRAPIDVFPGQEEALLMRTRQLEDSARNFRAQLVAALADVRDSPQ